MNKLKLIQIITKDLEELKTLTEEIAENQDNSSLITDLALSRSRLLCQELELLREYSVQPDDSLTEEEVDEIFNDEEDEISNQSISEPELEILHFEDQEFSEEDEPMEEEEDQIVYDSEEEEEENLNEEEIEEEEMDLDENQEKEDLTDEVEEEDEPEEEVEEESEEGELEEHELEETDEEEIDFEDEDEINNDEEYLEEEPQTEESEQISKTKTIHQPEVREITMDELDEDEEPMQFSPVSDSGSRPVMHEIPKPEELIEEENPVAETLQKERSLNDVIGENKIEETVLGSGPITSLRSAIGLNDRFLFIREIFGNNTDKFNSVIEHLDKLETIQEAVDYLRINLTLEKNETSLRFVDLLKRRFTK